MGDKLNQLFSENKDAITSRYGYTEAQHDYGH